MHALASHDRRLAPRMVDTDWLVLKGMHKVISGLTAQVARPGQVAIDYGCGSRPYEPLLTAAGCTYLGADFDGAPDLQIDSSGKLPAEDASADLVLSFQVLEHVRDLQTYFSEAHRVLRSNGWMILSTHGNWLYHPHPEDHRRWTRQGLVGEISANRFEVVSCAPVVGPLAWTSILRLTCVCFALKRVPLVGGWLSSALTLVINARAVLEETLTPAWVTQENACVYVTLCRPT